MKIKKRDLWNWIHNKTPVRYRDEIYRADYNGLYYMLRPIISNGRDIIKLYKKGRGVYGLETNKN